ncbi:hypothetical protein GCM10027047_13740 [Rhodococcus aerolatus]
MRAARVSLTTALAAVAALAAAEVTALTHGGVTAPGSSRRAGGSGVLLTAPG